MLLHVTQSLTRARQASRLKNQFRSLDEDELEFLDSVLESSRAQEASIRKDTAEKLAAFRKHQEDLEKAALAGNSSDLVEQGTEWAATSGKKRKKGQKEFLPGVKVRKTEGDGRGVVERKSSIDASEEEKKQEQVLKTKVVPPPTSKAPNLETTTTATIQPSTSTKPKASPILGLGLGNYSSEEDE
jgi:hypothetical protein